MCYVQWHWKRYGRYGGRHTSLKFGMAVMKFGQLIHRKIIKIVGTRCQILRLQCTKIDFGWGSASDPTVGAYSAPPDPLAGIKGGLLLREGNECRVRGRRKGGEMNWRERRGG